MSLDHVRPWIEKHGQAVADGDMDRALADFTAAGKAVAPPVVAKLPQPVNSAEVLQLTQEGEQYVAHIRYAGGGPSLTVRSTWKLEGDRPLIVHVEAVDA